MEILLERLAQGLRQIRYRYFRNLGRIFYRPIRQSVMSLLYLLSLGKGRRVKIAGVYPLQVEWERIAVDFNTFEAAFCESFAGALKEPKIVFDIGASVGEWTAFAATLVGPERVHIFEPNPQSWKDIAKVFKLNSLAAAGGIFPGFAADFDAFEPRVLEKAAARKWPPRIRGEHFFETIKNKKDIPVIKMDTYCERLKAIPSVMLIDVEGSEGEVLRGSEEILNKFHPVIFLSLHPKALQDFGDTKAGLIGRIEQLGYGSRLISVDHEEHWLFTPKNN